MIPNTYIMLQLKQCNLKLHKRNRNSIFTCDDIFEKDVLAWHLRSPHIVQQNQDIPDQQSSSCQCDSQTSMDLKEYPLRSSQQLHRSLQGNVQHHMAAKETNTY